MSTKGTSPNRLSLKQQVALVKWIEGNDTRLQADKVTRTQAALAASMELGFDVTHGNFRGILENDVAAAEWKGKFEKASPATVVMDLLARNAITALAHDVAALAKELGADTVATRAFALARNLHRPDPTD